LLGLKNRPRRVVFCVDSSGSMAKQSPGLPGSRWDDALRVIRTWITVLPIDEAALVTFNTAAHAFPKHRRLLNLSGPERAANIKLILKRLQETKPQGSTNLIDAVRCAFSFSEAEAVVLFSDGKPTKRAGFDPALANEILAEARQQKPRRKFVVVAVADYFDREASSFLVRLALENDGAFLGR
jgi:uncharacterized protein with von Willebrand factor type A (vWA) domain